MKKLFMLIVACIVVLAACGSKETKTERTDAQVEFKTDSGKTIKIPKAPKRIVVMGASYVGNLIDLE